MKINKILIIIFSILITSFCFSQNNEDSDDNQINNDSDLNLGFSYDYIIKYDIESIQENSSNEDDKTPKDNNEYEIRKQIEEYISIKEFENADKLYKKLINLYPRKDNYVEYASFLANRKKYGEADKIFRKSIINIFDEYRSVEDYYLKFKMYEELLNLYIDAFNQIDFIDLYLTKKILKLYDVLNQEEERADFIFQLLISDSEVIFSNILSDITNEIEEEEHNNDKLIEVLDSLLSYKDLSFTKKLEIKRKLGEIYFYKQQFEKSYSIYRELIISYFKLLNDNMITEFKIQTIVNKIIGDFLSIRKYDILINIYQIIIHKIQHKNQDMYIDYNYRLANTSKRNNELDYSLEKYKELKNFINSIRKNDKHLAIGDIRSFNLTLNNINYDIAEILYEKKDFINAIAYLSEITYPDRFNDRFLLTGKCYLAIKNLEMAKENFQLSYKNYSIQDSIQSLYYLSIISLLNDQKIKTLNYYENIILHTRSDESNITKDVLLKYEILLTMLNDDKRFNEFKEFEKKIHTYKYDEIINDITTHYKKYMNFNIEEYPYYIFNSIDILEKEKQHEKALTILGEIINKPNIQEIANGFYYQKAVFIKSNILIDYIKKNENRKIGIIIKNLVNLIVEYPKTIYLYKIKGIINEE